MAQEMNGFRKDYKNGSIDKDCYFYFYRKNLSTAKSYKNVQKSLYGNLGINDDDLVEVYKAEKIFNEKLKEFKETYSVI